MQISLEIQKDILASRSNKKSEFTAKKSNVPSRNSNFSNEKPESFNLVSIFTTSPKSQLDSAFNMREAKVFIFI